MASAPFDPRLLSRSRAAKSWIILSAILVVVRSLATIGIGIVAGQLVARVAEQPLPGSELFAQNTGSLVALAAFAAIRVAVAWAQTRFGLSAAAGVIADLRVDALSVLSRRDPRFLHSAPWRTILGTGLDGLTHYISGFLPALLATALATPLALAAVAYLDPSSALIAVVTLPLVPLFMWLIGLLTEGRTEARLRDVGLIREQIFDLIRGLPTLRAHGMLDSPTAEIERLSDAHKRSTMSVLRIAFLSSMALEFLVTLSVALVAVGIGFRLLAGDMTFGAGLAVLIIIPEVYGPVREVGRRFHDSQDGVFASTTVLDLLDSSTPTPSTSTPADTNASAAPAPLTVHFHHFSAAGRDGNRPRDLSATAEPGRITVLAGPNGSGKSTALLAALDIVTEDIAGHVSVDSDTRTLHGPELWQRCTYLPQRPVLDTEVMGDTSKLSLGQRQLAAFAKESSTGIKPLLVLDEPTAHLDQDSARALLTQIREHADAGSTVVIASHDPLVLAAADLVVEV